MNLGPHTTTNGPVRFSSPDTQQRATMHTVKDTHVLFGATTIQNTGTRDATLHDARLIGDVDPHAAQVVETWVIQVGRNPGTGDLLGASGWPNDQYKHWWKAAVPLNDATLAAGNAAEVIFIVDVNETGDWSWPQTAVDYEVGGMTYTALTNFGFQVCPPRPAPCHRSYS